MSNFFPRPIRGVFFDLDGTLLDTNPLILQSFQHTFRLHYGREVSLEDIRPFMGRPLRDAMEIMAPGNETAVIATYRTFNLEHHDRLAKIFPGVQEMIKALHTSGVRLAVVTSKTAATARRGLRLFQLESYFHAVIGVEETQKHKPEPEPVLAAINTTGVPPDACLMVGDSPHDLESGRKAGVRTAAVSWSQVAWPDVLSAQPDYIVHECSDVLTIVAESKQRGGEMDE